MGLGAGGVPLRPRRVGSRASVSAELLRPAASEVGCAHAGRAGEEGAGPEGDPHDRRRDAQGDRAERQEEPALHLVLDVVALEVRSRPAVAQTALCPPTPPTCARYRVQLLVGAIAVYFLGKLRFFNGVVRVVRMLPKQPMAAWLAILHVRFLGGGGGAVEAAAKLAAPG